MMPGSRSAKMLISDGEVALINGLVDTVDSNIDRLLARPFWVRRALLGEVKHDPHHSGNEWYVLVIRTGLPRERRAEDERPYIRLLFEGHCNFDVGLSDSNAIAVLQDALWSRRTKPVDEWDCPF